MIVPRRRKDGTTGYQVRASANGRRLPAETFDLRKDAAARERELLSQHDPGQFSRETCDSFARRWPDAYPYVKSGPTKGRRKTEGTNRTNTERLRPFIEEFRGVRLTAVDRPTARAFAVRHPDAAVVARNVFSDAMDDGLVSVNPFARLHLSRTEGRRHHAPLLADEVAQLERMAWDLMPGYGVEFAAMICFTAYTGLRLSEACALEWRDVQGDELDVRRAKFDKRRRVALLPDAQDALEVLPRRMDGRVFSSRRGRPLTKGSHFAIWDPVRKALWAQLPPERRAAVVDLDWHSLRHFCGHHFYVTLGFSDELTAYQLGHSDAKLVRDLYGHGRTDALARLKQGMRSEIKPIREDVAI